MPGRHSARTELSPAQRKAVRLEAEGLAAGKIAEAVGVGAATLSKWRATDRYWSQVEVLMREIDRDTVRSARRTRDAALKVITGALGRAALAVQAGEMSPTEASTVMRAALDVYRATSAQTGITETRRTEISAGPDADEEADAAAALIARLRDGR